MIRKLIWNDMKQNRLSCAATIFFMAVSAMLLALAVLLCSGLLGAIDNLMDRSQVPDYMQMHTGSDIFAKPGGSRMGSAAEALSSFAGEREEVRQWQICRFLNLDNSRITLGGRSLADSTQDNGLCVQGEGFDYLLDTESRMPKVLQGEVYAPACYRSLYELAEGDIMAIGSHELVIAGFIRDAQMNSMMASSKRFLVSAEDYGRIKESGITQTDGLMTDSPSQGYLSEEYLIEFRLSEGTDINSFAAAYAASGLPANGPAVTKPLVRMMNALADGTMILVIFLVSAVVLLISMLCIRFLCLTQMERERREMGMLKALGVGRTGIRRIYFAKYLLFSGWGAFAGYSVAFLLKAPLEKQIRELYGAAPGGIKAVITAFLAVILVEGILLLSVRGSLKKTERLSALEALFQSGERKKSMGQYIVIGLVAAACTFLALVPRNLYSTMSAPEFVTYMGIGDGEIRMDVRQTDNIDLATEQIASALRLDAEVERFAVLRTGSVRAVLPDGETISLTVETGDHSIFPVSYSEGSLPEKRGEIALSAMNADELGLDVGSTVRLMIDGKPEEYTVCGIYSDITNGGRTAKAFETGSSAPAMWSILYVSLNGSEGKGQWMSHYRQMGADVTDIADYVRDTYGQTLGQLRLAFLAVLAIAVLVIAVVVMLFMRLIVEKERYTVSLHKALGFTCMDMKRLYFFRGLIPVIMGLIAGILVGILCGERVCGLVLSAFGAESFRFVISWDWVLAFIPAVLLGPAACAVLMGIEGIRRIGAFECCRGNGQT